MRFIRHIFLLLLALFALTACASRSLDYEVKDEVVLHEPTWHKNYNSTTLNALVQTALKNNAELKTAVLNLQSALISAGVSRDELIPTLSAEASGSYSKDLSASGAAGRATRSFSSSLSLSYELDIFAKAYDGYKAADWQARSSRASLADLRLTIANSVVSSFFQIAYLNDVAHNLNSNLANQQELLKIAQTKYRYGRGEALAVNEAQENILSLQNQLLENKRTLATARETLLNLLAVQNASQFALDNITLKNIKLQRADLDAVSFADLASRSDVAVAAASLNAAFYTLKNTEKSLLPSITIGASLSDSDEKANSAFGFNLFGGNLRVNLPFLNYYKVAKNVKISKIDFEKRLVTYEDTISQAANEVAKFAALWQIDNERYANLEKLAEKEREIVAIYRNKYNYGKGEFRDLITAQNSLLSTQNSLLEAKQRLLGDEVGYFKAIGK